MEDGLLPDEERIKVDEPNDRLNVCKRQCKHCLFGNDPLIPWEPAGREKIEKALRDNQVGFTCHRYQNSMCSGYWQRHGKYQWFGRLAESMDAVRWIE